LDTWIDPDTERVRALHLEPLVDWITARWLTGAPTRILDLGCGDMLLSRLLPGGHVVDGFDPSEAARDAARAAGERSGTPGRVFDERREVPEGAYDGVVISSVVQYLPDEFALEEMLVEVRSWLRPDAGAEVVATDVPLPGGGRLRDARDLLAYLARRLGPIGALGALARATRRSPGHLQAFSEAQVLERADRAGLRAATLDRNLSPFSARASYAFGRTSSADVDPGAGST
jgi:SAM-dependent methyltransferase